MKLLVGYTGFVGSNIYAAGDFDGVYNSQNIQDAFGKNPDLLVYAGLRAEKFLANSNPEKDMEQILTAEENIKKINPKQLVLISTVDVFKSPNSATEETPICTEGLHAYGYNRYQLECWVREHYPTALIIRLPGLFGKNIKKNFIYDFINLIPSMLTQSKFAELSKKEPSLHHYYTLQSNGFYKLSAIDEQTKEFLKKVFSNLGFSALNFTDSRNVYQFYPLSRLWQDIQTALQNHITLWHPATEPVSTWELYHYLTGKSFVNEVSQNPVYYNFKTIHAHVFGGTKDYICDKAAILYAIKEFVRNAHPH